MTGDRRLGPGAPSAQCGTSAPNCDTNPWLGAEGGEGFKKMRLHLSDVQGSYLDKPPVESHS